MAMNDSEIDAATTRLVDEMRDGGALCAFAFVTSQVEDRFETNIHGFALDTAALMTTVLAMLTDASTLDLLSVTAAIKAFLENLPKRGDSNAIN